jgi:Na+/phosphate symporter
VVFVFASINLLYYIYKFVYVEPPMHPWDEANLVIVSDLSNILLDLVCHYFIENFASMCFKEISL